MAQLDHTPSFVRAALADPKSASDNALIATCDFYSDVAESEALDLVSEELVRRGGDPDYLGTLKHFETYV